jgi:hypothetical protein
LKRWIVSWHFATMLSGAALCLPIWSGFAFANTDDFGAFERLAPLSEITDLMAQSTTPPAPPPEATPAPAPPATIPAPATPAPATPAPTEPSVLPDLTPQPLQPDSGVEEEVPLPPAGTADEEEMGPEDVPVVETTELSTDMAKRAIDIYALVKEKYKDAEIEQYDNLQDFVDQNPRGKDFEKDIKAAGFQSVNDWNLAITTASFTYTNIVDDQTDDIKQQIEDIKKDGDLAQEVKDRMAASLAAMIPSANNRKVVEDLMKDPAYTEKIKILEVEEE